MQMLSADQAAELEARLAVGSRRPAAAHAVEISARNQLRGRIVAIEIEGLMAEVRLSIGGQELTSVITRASVERLRLTVGAEALAIIKATEIMIGRA